MTNPKLVPPTIEVTQHQIMSAFMRYTRETGLVLKADMFAIHIHPDTITHWKMTASGFLPMELITAVAEKRMFFGLKIVEDSDVDPAHPVLRCTWEMVL